MNNSAPSQSFIGYECIGSAAILTINRPSHANSYTQDMLDEMDAYLTRAENDEQIHVIVITGEGDKSFCAGADRHEIANRDWRSVLTLKSAAFFEHLRLCRKVTIAAINGVAVGGGFELLLNCDLRIAVDHARFWLPEPEFGLLPAAAATNLLPKLVGPLRAKDLILGGVRWSSRDAFNAGLLSQIVPPGELATCLQELLERLGKRHADALWLGKKAIHMSMHGVDTMQFDLLAQALLVLNQSEKVK